jgi:hypothetical protein
MQEPLSLVKRLLAANRTFNSLQALYMQATNLLRDFTLVNKLLLY